MEALGVAESLNNIAGASHRARYNPQLTKACSGGSLTVNPNVLAVVVLQSSIVVVNIYRRYWLTTFQSGENVLHHKLTVGPCKLQTEVHRFYIFQTILT